MKANLTQLIRTTTRVEDSLTLASGVMDLLPWQPPPDQDQDDADRLLMRIRTAARSRADTLRFFYAGSIISIYGAFEQFVESLVAEAVKRIANACPAYSDLPDRLMKNHELLTADVLTLMINERYHGPLQKRDLIAGLQQADAGYLPVRLNEAVFSHHLANCKWEVIRSIFERTGVSLAGLDENATFRSATQTLFPDESPFFVIDDVAQRRNEVAHGWEAEVLSLDLLANYVEIVEAFARALLEVVTSEVGKFVVEHAGRSLGRPDKLFQGRIAGFENATHAIETGDYIAAKGDVTRCVRVLELQSNNVTVESVAEGQSVGIRLSADISQRNRLYLLPKDAGYLQL